MTPEPSVSRRTRAVRACVQGLQQLWPADRFLRHGLLAYVLVQLVGAAWDLPSAIGWENDGVAPRDLFGGFAHNLTPGSGHRYPLFHYVLLGLLSLPALLFGVLSADAWTGKAIMHSVLTLPVMTAVSVAAKGLAIAMSCVTLSAMARMAERLGGLSAARWTVLFAIACLSFGYYGRTSNLDGPYVMWLSLALLRWMDVLERGEWADYRAFALLAAASIATKDQAYAPFVLPALLVAWPMSRGPRLPHMLKGAALGAFAYAALSGALFNPTGFVTRLGMLTGTNSQDWRTYPATWQGVVHNLQDLWLAQPEFWWPWPVVALAWLGVAWLALRPGGAARPVALLPWLAGISGLVAFTLVVARCEHRFVLPLGTWLALYAGLAAQRLQDAVASRAALRTAVTVLLAVAACTGLGRGLLLQWTQWNDGRAAVETHLTQLSPGSVVETYGLVVYLPRFELGVSAPYTVQRVGPRPYGLLPGVTEVQDRFDNVAARRPDVLVIPEGFANRYLSEGALNDNLPGGDAQGTGFFRQAVEDRVAGYRLALVARPTLPSWAQGLGLSPVEIHGSTARRVWVLHRSDP